MGVTMGDHRICSRCVMDSSAGDLVLDEEGHCNYCRDFLVKLERFQSCAQARLAEKDSFILKVKDSGRGREYDCIVGLSGGVDSSYALLLAVQEGLRPLAVHLDNGWNSEEAESNISRLVDRLGVDLHTHTIDWEENRDLQRSFFKANVVDIELLMDNAMLALNYQQASENRLKYVLSGHNLSTEGLDIPKAWNHCKYDVRNIRSIQRSFGTMPIRTHPLLSTVDTILFRFVKGIHWAYILDYYDYNKGEALEILKREVGYTSYPYKHYESVFTRFYQAHILPNKFGYDKRRPHLSSLVMSGQMSREEALMVLEGPPYPDPEQGERDRQAVMGRLGFSEEEFQDYMNAPEVAHREYGSEERLFNGLTKFAQALGIK